MLENWCWAPSVLKSLSKHYSYLSSEYYAFWEERSGGKPQPPDSIPEEMIDSMIRAKHVISGPLLYLRLLHYGLFDMAIHQPKSHKYIESLNLSSLFNQGRKDILQIDGPEALGEGIEWGHGYLMLGNWLVSNDYDVGFYGYL
jgi:metallopeptidase MepB